jgi:hypothetical protein
MLQGCRRGPRRSIGISPVRTLTCGMAGIRGIPDPSWAPVRAPDARRQVASGTRQARAPAKASGHESGLRHPCGSRVRPGTVCLVARRDSPVAASGPRRAIFPRFPHRGGAPRRCRRSGGTFPSAVRCCRRFSCCRCRTGSGGSDGAARRPARRPQRRSRRSPPPRSPCGSRNPRPRPGARFLFRIPSHAYSPDVFPTVWRFKVLRKSIAQDRFSGHRRKFLARRKVALSLVKGVTELNNSSTNIRTVNCFHESCNEPQRSWRSPAVSAHPAATGRGEGVQCGGGPRAAGSRRCAHPGLAAAGTS